MNNDEMFVDDVVIIRTFSGYLVVMESDEYYNMLESTNNSY